MTFSDPFLGAGIQGLTSGIVSGVTNAAKTAEQRKKEAEALGAELKNAEATQRIQTTELQNSLAADAKVNEFGPPIPPELSAVNPIVKNPQSVLASDVATEERNRVIRDVRQLIDSKKGELVDKPRGVFGTILDVASLGIAPLIRSGDRATAEKQLAGLLGLQSTNVARSTPIERAIISLGVSDEEGKRSARRTLAKMLLGHQFTMAAEDRASKRQSARDKVELGLLEKSLGIRNKATLAREKEEIRLGLKSLAGVGGRELTPSELRRREEDATAYQSIFETPVDVPGIDNPFNFSILEDLKGSTAYVGDGPNEAKGRAANLASIEQAAKSAAIRYSANVADAGRVDLARNFLNSYQQSLTNLTQPDNPYFRDAAAHKAIEDLVEFKQTFLKTLSGLDMLDTAAAQTEQAVRDQPMLRSEDKAVFVTAANRLGVSLDAKEDFTSRIESRVRFYELNASGLSKLGKAGVTSLELKNEMAKEAGDTTRAVMLKIVENAPVDLFGGIGGVGKSKPKRSPADMRRDYISATFKIPKKYAKLVSVPGDPKMLFKLAQELADEIQADDKSIDRTKATRLANKILSASATIFNQAVDMGVTINQLLGGR